ncbi:MAG: ECF transporter S component [Candidatus Saccharicenans sp.]|nr:MAG: ECF transporter S component [Candidatus Aminicenantes bacterium]HEK85323.1 ECF transporter S component [Candidatus Aminicenantes bacterium]
MSQKRHFELLLGGLFLALAIGLPPAFHLVGLSSTFLPMFYPVLLAGFLLHYRISVPVALMAPLVSAALTGMPPFYPPIAFIMMAEGLAMTLLPFLLFQRWRLNIYLSLAVTMLAERLILLLSTWVMADWLKLPGVVLGPMSLLKGLPGLVIIFLIIPPLVVGLKKKIKQMPFLPEESLDEAKSEELAK